MIGSVLLLAATAAAASDCSDAFDRAGRAGLNQCLERQLSGAEDDLQVAWAAALARAKSEDSRRKSSAPSRYADEFSSEAALVRAQDAWAVYRENHCGVQELSMWGGTGSVSLRLGCMNDLAQARQTDLMKFATTGQF